MRRPFWISNLQPKCLGGCTPSLTCPTPESLFRAWLAKACSHQNTFAGRLYLENKRSLNTSRRTSESVWEAGRLAHVPDTRVPILGMAQEAVSLPNTFAGSLVKNKLPPSDAGPSLGHHPGFTELNTVIFGHFYFFRRTSESVWEAALVTRLSDERAPSLGLPCEACTLSTTPFLELRKNKLSGGPPGTPRKRFPTFGFFDQSSL